MTHFKEDDLNVFIQSLIFRVIEKYLRKTNFSGALSPVCIIKG